MFMFDTHAECVLFRSICALEANVSVEVGMYVCVGLLFNM